MVVKNLRAYLKYFEGKKEIGHYIDHKEDCDSIIAQARQYCDKNDILMWSY